VWFVGLINNNMNLDLTRTNKKGFTLIELLVVVAIIAILVVIAISLFSGIQKRARDSRRSAEIDALAKSWEAAKNPEDGTYIYLGANAGDDYQADYPQNKPTDPKAGWADYCYKSSTNSTPPSAPTGVDAWLTGCPDGSWTQVPITNVDIFTDTANIGSWIVCARLESNNIEAFCKTSLTR
jgi:prepilin-type N-terminal cleavage/methylation domain-containing protein